MEYLGLRFKDLDLEIMLCLGSYVLKEQQEPNFIFLATRPGSILAKMKKTLVIMSQNYYILVGYAFANRETRNHRHNLLLTLRATFSKIQAP